MKTFFQVAIGLVMLLGTHEAFCQFNKGRFIVGGSVRLSSSNNESAFSGTTTKTKNSSFSLAPNVGYFIIDNLAVGASVGLGTGAQTSEGSGNKASYVSASVGPFVRYYLPIPVFIQAATLFGFSKYKYITTAESESTYNVTQLGLAAGYAWLLNDFVALEPMLGYQTYTNKNRDNDTKTTDGSFYLSCAFTIYLGERK